MLDLWSRRPKLLTNQVRSLGLLRPWNGDCLKSGKKSHFVCEISHFLRSYNICWFIVHLSTHLPSVCHVYGSLGTFTSVAAVINVNAHCCIHIYMYSRRHCIKTVTFPFRVNGTQALPFVVLSPAHHRCISIPFLFCSDPSAHASTRNTLMRYHAHSRGHDWYREVKIQLQESRPNFTSCQWDRLHLCYRDAILRVPAKLFVAGDCSVYSSWPLECCPVDAAPWSWLLSVAEGFASLWSWLLEKASVCRWRGVDRSRNCSPQGLLEAARACH